MDPRTIVDTRTEWREIGFYYDRDEESREWRLVGSRAGLLRFSGLLRDYVADPRNVKKSEHEHYGPYCYLEVMTWPESGIDAHAIHGPLDALKRLAVLVEQKIAGLRPGEEARIREEFALDSEYSLVLQLQADGFDPASADRALPRESADGGSSCSGSPPPVSCSSALAELYAEDRREHAEVPPVATLEYRALRERDQQRRHRAAELLASLKASSGCSAEDLYHAAWLFNHGDQPAEARRAHELARRAAERGHRPARWLAAAANDRWCMYEGRPQRYGTQFVPDGVRYRLWDVELTTTDEERAAWNVPPLAEQLRRADELTRSEPQPPMDEAPSWLRAAIERWSSER